jgi:anti-anti-sigma factor
MVISETTLRSQNPLSESDQPQKGGSVIETDRCAGPDIVCKPLKELDWADAMTLRDMVRNSLQPGVELVIDLSRVDFIDLVGINAVVSSVRLARALGGTARICNARPQVQRVMVLVGVYRLLMRGATARTDAA